MKASAYFGIYRVASRVLVLAFLLWAGYNRVDIRDLSTLIIFCLSDTTITAMMKPQKQE